MLTWPHKNYQPSTSTQPLSAVPHRVFPVPISIVALLQNEYNTIERSKEQGLDSRRLRVVYSLPEYASYVERRWYGREADPTQRSDRKTP